MWRAATLLWLWPLLLITGCAGLGERSAPAVAGAETDSARITAALHAQHRDWAGTPYRLGGLSRSGIDCSGFVQTTYRTRFGLELPRTTELQARQGRAVPRAQIRPGDLVFFRTGNDKRHVGIYVEDGVFLHASTSRGVMLSRLDNPYWAAHYRKARRL